MVTRQADYGQPVPKSAFAARKAKSTALKNQKPSGTNRADTLKRSRSFHSSGEGEHESQPPKKQKSSLESRKLRNSFINPLVIVDLPSPSQDYSVTSPGIVLSSSISPSTEERETEQVEDDGEDNANFEAQEGEVDSLYELDEE